MSKDPIWKRFASTLDTSEEKDFALVSLVSKEGSSYLQPGARLLVRSDGFYIGEISAGCLEQKISSDTIDCIRKREHKLLTVDTRPFYGCYGTLTLLIERIQNIRSFKQLVHEINLATDSRRAIRLITNYGDLDKCQLTTLGSHCNAECSCLTQTIEPPIKLVTFGKWPDSCASIAIAKQLGWHTKVFGDNETLLSQFRQEIDERTALLIATHNLAQDVSILRAVLDSPFGYIGVIGSKRRWREIENAICDLNDYDLIQHLQRVHCPAGLDLGGEGANSMALSIVSEIQAEMFGRDGNRLIERNLPIHSDSITP
ncbi:MAG: XdhC family protein [Verrucomicrobiota bacterium]